MNERNKVPPPALVSFSLSPFSLSLFLSSRLFSFTRSVRSVVLLLSFAPAPLVKRFQFLAAYTISYLVRITWSKKPDCFLLRQTILYHVTVRFIRIVAIAIFKQLDLRYTYPSIMPSCRRYISEIRDWIKQVQQRRKDDYPRLLIIYSASAMLSAIRSS